MPTALGTAVVNGSNVEVRNRYSGIYQSQRYPLRGGQNHGQSGLQRSRLPNDTGYKIKSGYVRNAGISSHQNYAVRKGVVCPAPQRPLHYEMPGTERKSSSLRYEKYLKKACPGKLLAACWAYQGMR
jgi:hypothetical protein